MKRKIIFISVISVVFVLFNVFASVSSIDIKPIYNNTDYANNKDTIISENSNKILINGEQGWADLKKEGKCSGNGIWDDPYIIRNLEIDAQHSGSCITIIDSNVYFRIENCTLSGAGYGDVAGIFLQRVDNGKLLNNNCSFNNGHGIYLLDNCKNITIVGNEANNNEYCGIKMDVSCKNNNISQNIVNDNDECGIFESMSRDNNISRNIIEGNGYYGIYLEYSRNNVIFQNNVSEGNNYGIGLKGGDYNVIVENNVSNNGYGITLKSLSNSNTIYLNNFSGNCVNSQDFGTTNLWDNGTIGNYWDDYDGFDCNGNGIGETPYIVAGSNESSQDNFPIWDVADTFKPLIYISRPIAMDIFGVNAPAFDITIDEYILNSTWYMVMNGTDAVDFAGNTTFTYLANFSILQGIWEQFENGTLKIRFYANDSMGNMNYTDIIVRKDIIKPKITILCPISDDVFMDEPPCFNFSIIEPNLDKVWYMLNNVTKKYFLLENGSTDMAIDIELWDSLRESLINLTLYVNDTAGNIGFAKVVVYKYNPPEINDDDDNDDNNNNDGSTIILISIIGTCIAVGAMVPVIYMLKIYPQRKLRNKRIEAKYKTHRKTTTPIKVERTVIIKAKSDIKFSSPHLEKIFDNVEILEKYLKAKFSKHWSKIEDSFYAYKKGNLTKKEFIKKTSTTIGEEFKKLIDT
ncbi:hypothetical protein ES705_14465 [subsurface metagenome]